MKQSEFEKNIAYLQSDESDTYEQGYRAISGVVDKFLDELLKLAADERNGDIRSRYVELIGKSSARIAIEFLKSELENPHVTVRMWAYISLRHSVDDEARAYAEAFSVENPQEEFI